MKCKNELVIPSAIIDVQILEILINFRYFLLPLTIDFFWFSLIRFYTKREVRRRADKATIKLIVTNFTSEFVWNNILQRSHSMLNCKQNYCTQTHYPGVHNLPCLIIHAYFISFENQKAWLIRGQYYASVLYWLVYIPFGNEIENFMPRLGT